MELVLAKKVKYTILVPDFLENSDIERKILGRDVQILTPLALDTAEIPDRIWKQADIIMPFDKLEFPKKMIHKLERCKGIVRMGVGFDNIDRATAGRLGIVVCNIPDYGTTEVADHAMAMLLNLARGINIFNNSAREGEWKPLVAGPLRRITGATLGVIGLGRIGTATAMRAKGFGLKVKFYDPYLPEGTDKALGFERCYSLKDLLGSSDYVTIHTPLSEETAGMVDSKFFKMMKKGSIFINTGRGGVLDVDALYRALKSGHLHAAGIDVWPIEPPADYALIRQWQAEEPWIKDRLIVTPHSAFYSADSFTEMRTKGALEAIRVLKGEPVLNCVNEEWLKKPRYLGKNK